MSKIYLSKGEWTSHSNKSVEPKSYTCFNCNAYVNSEKGFNCNYTQSSEHGTAYICPNRECNCITTFDFLDRQFPKAPYGTSVEHIDSVEVKNIYQEARDCISVGANTACVLACRKLIMNVAVHQGAGENKSFTNYIEYLSTENHLPNTAKPWVDAIRLKGNEATHEIPAIKYEDAKLMVDFSAMLLQMIYEMPGKLKQHSDLLNPD